MKPFPSEKPRRIRRRRPGDLGQLRSVLWQVLLEVEALVQGPAQDADRKIRAVHALATLAGAYLKTHEQHELLKRLEALESALSLRKVV